MSPGVDCRVFIFKVIEDGSGAISDSKFQLVGRTPLVLSSSFVSNESLEDAGDRLSWTGPLKAGRYLLVPSTTGCRMKKRREQPESDVRLVSRLSSRLKCHAMYGPTHSKTSFLRDSYNLFPSSCPCRNRPISQRKSNHHTQPCRSRAPPPLVEAAKSP